MIVLDDDLIISGDFSGIKGGISAISVEIRDFSKNPRLIWGVWGWYSPPGIFLVKVHPLAGLLSGKKIGVI